MREITYYEAYDGTRFDSEYECMIYEGKALRPGVRLYDGTLNSLEWKDSEEFVYVNVVNESALEAHDAIYGFLGYNNIKEKGMYIYDGINDTCVSLDDKITRYEKILKEMKEAKERMLADEQSDNME